MKSLALYIDKWYIVGTVCTDSNIRQVSLPNKEDRIWLYFREDTDSDTISYGKGFKEHYWNHENHYYGDVFTTITNLDAKFIRSQRLRPLKEIFKSAKIFDDLRAAMEEEGNIKTYLSFSEDVSLLARKLFIEQLEEAGFEVAESVARIEHLALETAMRRNGLQADGFYLTLNASNENLHYAIYHKTGDLFVRKAESELPGMGNDLRSRSLIEYVINNINRTERFLKDEKEREREYQRATQFVDNWLVRLANARPHIPISIQGITLSLDPYKTYQVQVIKDDIDERTADIVNSVVDEIASFVSRSGIRQEELCGILLLGNSMNNSQFKELLLKRYSIPPERIIKYQDKDLSSLVGVYSAIDCNQFKDLNKKFAKDADAELLRIQNIKEQTILQQKADADAANVARKRQEREEEERRFKDAMDNGYKAEGERDYDNMADYFKIAHELRPKDEEAEQKYDEALRLKAEASVRMNTYKERIKEAKAACKVEEWEAARQKAEEALSANPESEEAKRISAEASRIIKQSKEFDRYIVRADTFIAQKLYDEALKELRKARLTGINDNEVAQRETKIRKEQAEAKLKIERLTAQVKQLIDAEHFDEAIQTCNELLELDLVNKTRWTSRIADIRALQEKRREENKRIETLQKQIKDAHWNDDWAKLESLCQEYLAVRHNEEVEKLLRRATTKLSTQRAAEAWRQNLAEVNDLIAHAEFETAEKKLRDLEKHAETDEQRRQLKDLRRVLFAREAEAEATQEAKRRNHRDEDDDFLSQSSRSAGHKPVTGFKTSRKESFFEEPVPRKVATRKEKKARPSQSRDEFFDSQFRKPQRKDSGSSVTGKITNDDFNF